jgi:hypothetical protein
MTHRKMLVATIMILSFTMIALVLIAYAAINVSVSINSSGSIAVSPNIGVYSDSACTVQLTTINWGSPSPGATVSQTVYIKNTQGSTSLTLSMTTSNWNPTSANGPLTIAWNKQCTVIAPGQPAAATLTLTMSSSITGITTFSVQISISGTS